MKKIMPFAWIAAIWLAIIWLRTTDLWKKQYAVLHWNYIGSSLFFIPPIVGLIIARDRWETYGLGRSHVWSSTKAGLLFAVPLILFPLGADLFLGSLSVRPVIQGRVLQTLFYKLIMVGFAEELLFRGFFQGELNETFSKRFRLLGARVSVGFWITAAVFSFCHFIPGSQPLPLWQWLYIIAAALFLGWLRERTQSLAAPVLIHFGLHVHRTLFGMSIPAGLATGVAWFLAFWFLPKLLEKEAVEQSHGEASHA